MLQARDISRERFRMREQKMRKQNWLRMLHVRHARHRNMEIGLRLQQERIQQGCQPALNFGSRINHKQTKIGSDEFVAAAASVQFPT